jgi:hypothetical protein
MDIYAYKGILSEDGSYVNRVKSIIASDGKHYRGELGIDSRGLPYVYNQVPNTGVIPVVPVMWNDSAIWNDNDIWRDGMAV